MPRRRADAAPAEPAEEQPSGRSTPDDQLLSIAEAARLAGLNPDTVRAWHEDPAERFPSLYLSSKCVRIPAGLFKRWLVERMKRLGETTLDPNLRLNVQRRMPVAEQYLSPAPRL
jgi:hypothetical protein